MPRRPTTPPSERNSLHDRLADVAGDGETSVDEAHDLFCRIHIGDPTDEERARWAALDEATKERVTERVHAEIWAGVRDAHTGGADA